MKTAVKLIGAGIIGIASVAIPMLTIVSIYGNWNSFVTLTLSVADLAEVGAIMSYAYDRSEE